MVIETHINCYIDETQLDTPRLSSPTHSRRTPSTALHKKRHFFYSGVRKRKKMRAAGARPEAGEKEEGKGKEEEGRRRVYELCTVV